MSNNRPSLPLRPYDNDTLSYQIPTFTDSPLPLPGEDSLPPLIQSDPILDNISPNNIYDFARDYVTFEYFSYFPSFKKDLIASNLWFPTSPFPKYTDQAIKVGMLPQNQLVHWFNLYFLAYGNITFTPALINHLRPKILKPLHFTSLQLMILLSMVNSQIVSTNETFFFILNNNRLFINRFFLARMLYEMLSHASYSHQPTLTFNLFINGVLFHTWSFDYNTNYNESFKHWNEPMKYCLLGFPLLYTNILRTKHIVTQATPFAFQSATILDSLLMNSNFPMNSKAQLILEVTQTKSIESILS